MPEPTLSEVRTDILGALKHDERLRHVEQQQSAQSALIAQLPDMEKRLMAAIADAKPKNVAQWASVLIASAAVVVAMLALGIR